MARIKAKTDDTNSCLLPALSFGYNTSITIRCCISIVRLYILINILNCLKRNFCNTAILDLFYLFFFFLF